MNTPAKLLLSLSLFCLSPVVFADSAGLRFRCDADSDGADVFINGQLKGQCPVDVFVAEGQISVKVVKKVDPWRYRSFERSYFLSGGASKSVDVVLGAVTLTPEGQKRENDRIAAEKAAAEAAAARAAAEKAAAAEAARRQAEIDAPRIAAEKEAARLKKIEDDKLAAAQAEELRKAEYRANGQVKRYLQMMSTEGPKANVSSATLATIYAPVFLPISTLSDLAEGRDLALTDPAVFGNPDSMMAKASQTENKQRDNNLIALRDAR